MNTKYNSFLIESKLNEIFILLEAKLYGTERFLSILNDISSTESNISFLAWNLKNLFRMNLKNIDQNYFDLIDGKNDKLSFIQNNKVGDPSTGFNLPGRNEIKLGRTIRYLLKLLKEKEGDGFYGSLNDSDIEEFVNVFKSLNSEADGLEFKLISGDEIKGAYDSDNYYNAYGSLGGSCMNDVSGKLKIYRKNPEKIKLLVLFDSKGSVHGRAIVWNLFKSPCDAKYYMDRIYVNKDSDKNRFIKFANDNNYMYRKNIKADNHNNVIFIYKGDQYNGEISVELDNIDFNKYPYIDTLCFLDTDKKTLSNLVDVGNLFLQSTDGNGDVCDYCYGNIIITNWNGESVCDVCTESHTTLGKLGIRTKWSEV